MAPQVRVWVVTDDLGMREAGVLEEALPEPRQQAEYEYPIEHIVLGYN